MIKSIHINNFQSHKDTVINFETNGVSVIIGNSDQGKSAVLRALLWAVNNRPLGTDDIVSFWARDEKGKIADQMAVFVHTEKGCAARKRTLKDNEYIIYNKNNEAVKTFSAINKDVPEDITDFFRLTDTNIQCQHDAPFLLSASASDVAKYFNKIVRLDVIDRVLQNAESARRELNKKIKEHEQEKTSLEKQINEYCWIENAQEALNKLNKVKERINVYENDKIELYVEMEEFKDCNYILKNYPDRKKAIDLIEKIEALEIDYNGLEELRDVIKKHRELNRARKLFAMIEPGKIIVENINEIKERLKTLAIDRDEWFDTIKSYGLYKEKSKTGFDKNKALKLLKEYEDIQPDYDMLNNLSAQIQEHGRTVREKEGLDKDAEIYKKELPELCPECGQPLLQCNEGLK